MEEVAEPLSIAVGRAIARLRFEAGLTLEDLADRAGVHRTTVGLIERGQRNLTVVTAARLAAALGILASDLIAAAEARTDLRRAAPRA